MADLDIQELERKIAEGDLTAWDALDAALERSGLRPRRIWIAWERGGEYSDTWEHILAVRFKKDDALKVMLITAAKETLDQLGSHYAKEWRINPKDPEHWIWYQAGTNVKCERRTMSITWEEVK